jgi:hypothetical protein
VQSLQNFLINSTLLLPAWPLIFGSLSIVDGSKKRRKEKDQRGVQWKKKELAACADLFLARAGYVFFLEISSSICEWHLF